MKILKSLHDGNTVINERVDTIKMKGKSADIPVAGVFELNNAGKIAVWRDYFDLATLVLAFPPLLDWVIATPYWFFSDFQALPVLELYPRPALHCRTRRVHMRSWCTPRTRSRKIPSRSISLPQFALLSPTLHF